MIIWVERWTENGLSTPEFFEGQLTYGPDGSPVLKASNGDQITIGLNIFEEAELKNLRIDHGRRQPICRR